MNSEKLKITVEVEVKAPIEKVWDIFNDPQHIVKWATASDDWHTTKVENDVRVGGVFFYRMEAKDGSAGFDLSSMYDEVVLHKSLVYTMNDGRRVWITFSEKDGIVHIHETFEAENENPPEFQKQGWQTILDNFKKYTESH